MLFVKEAQVKLDDDGGWIGWRKRRLDPKKRKKGESR